MSATTVGSRRPSPGSGGGAASVRRQCIESAEGRREYSRQSSGGGENDSDDDSDDSDNGAYYSVIGGMREGSYDRAEQNRMFDEAVETLRCDPELHVKARVSLVPVYDMWMRQEMCMPQLLGAMRLASCDDPRRRQQHVVHEAPVFDQDQECMAQLRQQEMDVEDFIRVWQASPFRGQRDLSQAMSRLETMCKGLLTVLYHVRLAKQNFHVALENATKISPLLESGVDKQVDAHFKSTWGFHPLSSVEVKDDRLRLVVFLLHRFHELGYRRKRDSDHVYTQVVHVVGEEGRSIYTYAYEPGMTIVEAMMENIRKESRADLYQAILKNSIVSDVATFLKRCAHNEFPMLRVKDCMFSFLDGVYDCETDRFAYYRDVPEVFPELAKDEHCTYKFFPQPFAPVYYRVAHEDCTPYHRMPSAVVPSDSTNKLPWQEICNTNLEKIFADQKWGDETVRLKYATMGRTLWRAGTKDCWQCVTMDIGASGTGKSTCQFVWQNIFHFTDVMVFGANQEDRFGRDKLPDKRIFLAPDMRGDSFGISVEFFLVLAGNDSAVFPVKFGEPRFEPSITTPGMLATNELPPAFRNDIRGSVWRRLLPFPYPNEISPLDPQLKKRILETEIPGILRKAACAYLAHDRTRDIMTNPLPPEVEQERNKLQRASNSLIDFLMSEGHVLLDPDKMVERCKFIEAYGGFCKNVRRCKPSNFHEDFTRVPFLKMGLREEVHDQKQYIVGCELMLTYEQHNEGDL